MRGKNGFSLIELLAVIVIIGLILLVVIPAVTRLITNNADKEYNNYLKIIDVGAKRYAEGKQDDLGGSNDTGCIELSLSSLIKAGYVKEFEDNEITCSGDVRINNNEGKLGIFADISCVDKDKNETFSNNGIDHSNSCVAFVPSEDSTLKKKIAAKYGIVADGDKKFINTNKPDNYVWYSGKNWRIVYYNDSEIKLLSDEIISVVPMSSSNSTTYSDSIINHWLQSYFKDTLKSPDEYLKSTNWDATPTYGIIEVPTGSEMVYSDIGLLNSYEVSKMGDFFDDNYKWLLSTKNSSDAKIRLAIDGGGLNIVQETYDSDNYYYIRPAITMKPDIYVIGGNGSKNNPYILKGNSTNIPRGTLLNTRYSGEYLYLDDILYRIVHVDGGYTKVIMVDSLPERKYCLDPNYDNTCDIESVLYSSSSIYDYLNNSWYDELSNITKIMIYRNSTWCQKNIKSPSNFYANCSHTPSAIVGLPSLGEMYTININGSNDSFWLIDFSDSGYMNIIDSSGKNKLSISEKVKVKPVLYLNNNVIIKDGKGNISDPFKLSVK